VFIPLFAFQISLSFKQIIKGMSQYLKIFSFLIFLQIIVRVPAYADKYPFNYNIDILHYRFDLSLSDSSDVIHGTASITVYLRRMASNNSG